MGWNRLICSAQLAGSQALKEVLPDVVGGSGPWIEASPVRIL